MPACSAPWPGGWPITPPGSPAAGPACRPGCRQRPGGVGPAAAGTTAGAAAAGWQRRVAAPQPPAHPGEGSAVESGSGPSARAEPLQPDHQQLCAAMAPGPGHPPQRLDHRAGAGGWLALAVPVAGSFPQWHQAADRARVPCTARRLPEADTLIGAAASGLAIGCLRRLVFSVRYGPGGAPFCGNCGAWVPATATRQACRPPSGAGCWPTGPPAMW